MKKIFAVTVQLLLYIFFAGFVILPSLKAQNLINGKEIREGVFRGKQTKYLDREIAVKLKSTTTSTSINHFISTRQGHLIKQFDELGWGIVELPEQSNTLSEEATFETSSLFDAVELNQIMQTQLEPNDTYYQAGKQWGLAHAHVPAAWNYTTGNSNVILAILDSGIPKVNGALSHPDLQNTNKIILGPDYYLSETQNDTDKDINGHGTHVAGIAAAETNNATGIAGITWGCKLLIIKALNVLGTGTTSTFYQGVTYAVNYQRNHPGTRVVINFSADRSSGGTNSQEEDAITYARTYNVPIVVAAGNTGGDGVLYPAAYSQGYDNVLAVNSTYNQDFPSLFDASGCEVTLTAPGELIFSTTPNYPVNLSIAQNYDYLSGTSMAAPFVTGALGLLLSINPSYTAVQLRDIVTNSTDHPDFEGRTPEYGYGMLDIAKAMQTFIAPVHADGNIASMATNVYDPTVTSVWPGHAANTPVQQWNTTTGNYEDVTSLEMGRGYWVQFPSAQDITYLGNPVFGTVLNVYATSATQWNMIGSYSKPIAIANVVQSPANNVQTWFKYTPGAGYEAATEIEPGQGYWIKINQSGTLQLTLYPYVCGLVSPDKGATEVEYSTLPLVWNRDAAAAYYELEVSLLSWFGTFVIHTNVDQPAAPATQVTYQLAGLGGGVTYYWRVRTHGAYQYSDWSCTWNFTTKTITAQNPPDPPCFEASSLSSIDQFTILNSNGDRQSMYVWNGTRELPPFLKNVEELPPLPPRGKFSARFSSGKFIESIPYNHRHVTIPIKLRDISYPFTIAWKLKASNYVQYWIHPPGNNNDRVALPSEGQMTFTEDVGNTLLFEAQSLAPPPCNSKTSFVGNSTKESSTPASFMLGQNFPNPFNPTTRISYTLPEDTHVKLTVINVLGEEVAILTDEFQVAGYKSVEFNAGRLPSSVYFYRLQTDKYTETKKMLLAR